MSQTPLDTVDKELFEQETHWRDVRLARLKTELNEANAQISALRADNESMLNDLQLCYQAFLDQHSSTKRLTIRQGIDLGVRLASYWVRPNADFVNPSPPPPVVPMEDVRPLVEALRCVADHLRAEHGNIERFQDPGWKDENPLKCEINFRTCRKIMTALAIILTKQEVGA